MRLSKYLLCMFICFFVFPGVSFSTQTLEERIESLVPFIGGHPPNIRNEEELKSIKEKYEKLKSELDSLLAKDENDQKLLYLRGWLQSMGHNFDYPGAWQGSTDDLSKILKTNPNNIPAILELANLWVNSSANLAPNAERLFRGAQCFNGDEPIEEAQRGIFFALYYQGKIKDALKQAAYLKNTWPTQEQYKRLYEMTMGVLKKNNIEIEETDLMPDKLAMAKCSQN